MSADAINWPSIVRPLAGGAAALGLVAVAMAAKLPSRAPSTSALHRLTVVEPSPIAFRALIRRHLSEGRGEEALEEARRFVRVLPRSALAQLSLGIVIAETGAEPPAAAEAAFESAIRLDPRNPDGYVNLARLAERLGDRQRAFSEYDRAASACPTSVDARLGFARIAGSFGYATQATEAFNLAIKMDPARAETYALLGTFLVDIGRAVEARPSLDRAFALGERSSHFLAAYAYALADQPEDPHDLPRALAMAAQAEKDGEASSLLYYGWGLAHQRSEQYAEAVKKYQLAIKLNAGANGAYIGISQCLRALGRTKEADAAAQRGTQILSHRQQTGNILRQIRLYPNRTGLREKYAAILMDKGDYLIAADQYRYLAQHSPKKSRYWSLAADAFERGGKRDIAAYLRRHLAGDATASDR